MKKTKGSRQKQPDQLDRVVVSFERAVKHYGNGFSCFASLGTNVEPGEAVEVALARAHEIVRQFVVKKVAVEMEVESAP